jgi:alpha-tubulin suppressor-like RCC1 family protein
MRGYMRFFSLIAALVLIGMGCVSQKESASKLLSEGKPAPDVAAPLTVPNNVAPTGDSGVSKVVAGVQHACAIRSGRLACWGLNKHGQIGNGDSGVTAGVNDPLTGSNYLVKVVVAPFEVFPNGVSDVALGFEHTCAIRNEELFCWGSNEFGQIGGDLSSTGVSARPVSVLTSVKQVSARGRWTCAVSSSGQLVCFGTRLVKIANGTVSPKRLAATPMVMYPSGVRSVSLSSNHGCVVMTSGALQCFGMNQMGEIGNGATDPVDVGVPYTVFSSGVTAVSGADGRTCAVVSGVMKCFGASLGDREIDRTAGAWKERTPVAYEAVFWSGIAPGLQISSSGAVIASNGDLLYGSFFHANGAAQKIALGVAQFSFSETDLVGCMMFRNHAVKCWGPNVFGQLGIGRRSAEEFSISQARDVAF